MTTHTTYPMNQTDLAIATLLNNELKSCAAMSAKSACECVTPEFRNALAAISQDAIRRQERLATIMAQKGWYVAPQADTSTLNMLVPQLQHATRGFDGALGGGTAFTPPRV